MVSINPLLGKNEIQLRPSMIKYPCKDPRSKKYLDVLDWNKYRTGYLNRQIIILLWSISKVPDFVFKKLQEQYLKEILKFDTSAQIQEYMEGDRSKHYKKYYSEVGMIFKCAKSPLFGIDFNNHPFFQGFLDAVKRSEIKKLKDKAKIKVNKSARLIGVRKLLF